MLLNQSEVHKVTLVNGFYHASKVPTLYRHDSQNEFITILYVNFLKITGFNAIVS